MVPRATIRKPVCVECLYSEPRLLGVHPQDKFLGTPLLILGTEFHSVNKLGECGRKGRHVDLNDRQKRRSCVKDRPENGEL